MSAIRARPPWWALVLLVLTAVAGLFAAGRPLVRAVVALAERRQADAGDPDLLAPVGEHIGEPGASPVAAAAESAAAESTGIRPEPEDRVPDPAFYSAWTTYDAALRQSNENGKPVLLDFRAEWCEGCQLLKREVFNDPAAGLTVKAAVIPVAVLDRVRENDENPPEVEALQRRYQVEEFPTLIVFSPVSGRTLRQQGYPGAAATLRWITEAADAVR